MISSSLLLSVARRLNFRNLFLWFNFKPVPYNTRNAQWSISVQGLSVTSLCLSCSLWLLQPLHSCPQLNTTALLLSSLMSIISVAPYCPKLAISKYIGPRPFSLQPGSTRNLNWYSPRNRMASSSLRHLTNCSAVLSSSQAIAQ